LLLMIKGASLDIHEPFLFNSLAHVIVHIVLLIEDRSHAMHLPKSYDMAINMVVVKVLVIEASDSTLVLFTH
jgi:hypothetical protein